MARRIWGKRRAGNGKDQMGRAQQIAALLAVLIAGVAAAALLGGSSYAYQLVSGGSTDSSLSFQSLSPSITSDKDDYAPGETVTLRGSGWGAAEGVHLFVNDDVGKTWSYSADVTADADGAFTHQFQLPSTFVATYAVTATGDSGSVARTTFTDGTVRVKAVGAGGPVPVDWVRYSNTTCTPGAGNANVIDSGSISAITGGNGTDIPVDVDATRSLKLTAGAVSGASFSSWSNGDFSDTNANPTCLKGSGSTQNTMVNYTTVTNRATSTALARTTGSSPSVYGTALTFTATVTATGGNPSSVGTVTFKNGASVICGPVALSGNTATCSPSLDVGSYTLTAEYSGGLSGSVQFLSSTSGSLAQSVTAKSVTGSFTAANKVYDGDASATIVTRSLAGTIAGDDVSLTGGTATFANKNVGTGKTVTGTGFSLGGADAGNYSLTSVGTTTANISAKSVTGSFTAADKVYDGNNSATVTGRSLSGTISGDDISLSGGTATFANKNVGTGKTVTLAGATLAGGDAGNYSLGSVATATANITAKAVTGSFTASNKVYDGTTAATVTGRSLSGTIAGDDISLTGGTATFANKNVGTGKTVTLAGASLGGGDAGNYSLSSVATTTANITVLTITAAFSTSDKEYDRTTNAAITDRVLFGAISGDDVHLSGGTASFADKNVGAGKTVTGTGFSLTGTDAPNYALASTTLTATADITRKSVEGHFTAADKTYDATAAATILTRTLTGSLSGDDVSLTGGSATFSDKNVGTSKTVTGVGFSLSGSDAGNYSLSSSTLTTTASITAKDVDGHITAANKVYDGTTAASIASRSLTGAFAGDFVSLAGGTATFEDKNVGDGKEVTATGFSLGGSDAGNYHLTSTTLTATADITALGIEPHITAANKTYDGTTVATILTRYLTGAIAGDDVSLTGGTADFVDRNVGTAKSVVGTGFSLDGDDAGNYLLSPSTAATTADITPLTVTGSFTAANKEYDRTTAATITSRSLSGQYPTDFVALAGGTATFDTKDVGSGKTVTGTGFSLSGVDAGNYSLASSILTTSADITPRSVTGSFTAENKEYDGTTAAVISGRSLFGVLAPDDVVLAGGSATFDSKDAGIGKMVTATGFTLAGADAGNYSLYASTLMAQADITKAPLTVTADDKSREYGESNPAFTASYSGFKNGETLATSGVTGSPSLSTAATNSSDVGDYAITAAVGSLASGNYEFSFAPGTLSITKAPLLVTADDKSREYGESNPAFSASYSGFKLGQNFDSSDLTGAPSLTTTATDSSDVGDYAIAAAVGSLASGNYEFSFAPGTLSITKAPLLVTADNKSREYGEANPTFTASYSGFKLGQNFDSSDVTGAPSLSTEATQSSDVGAYEISAAVGTLASGNYEFSFAPGTLSITKAPLTVTADNKSREYGEANPAFTASYSGFKLGQDFDSSDLTGAPSLSTEATQSSDVGEYDITAAVGSLSSGNYEFGFASGTLTITKAPLTVTADNKSREYGESNPAFTASYSGFKLGQNFDSSDLTGAPSLATAATEASGAGAYEITAAVGTLASGNYALSFASGTLTITKAPLTVTADDKSREYGESNPAFTASYSGFKNGETLATSGVTGSPSLSTAATNSSDVGDYAITAAVGSLASGNYEFSFAPGTLSITKAPLLVTADDKSREYGESNPAFSASYSGFKLGQNFDSSDLTGAPSLTTTATQSSDVGAYQITAAVGSLASANYELSFANGTLTITKAPLSITAADKSRDYGEPNPALTGSILGIKNGDGITASYSTAATQASDVGGYAIVPAAVDSSPSKLGNYNVALHNGTLTITKAPLSITAADKSREYGEPNPALTGSIVGIKNGDGITAGYSTAATQTSDVGGYAIVPAAVDSSPSKLGNYNVALHNGTLTITKAPLDVTADDKSKVYGDANPTLTASYSSFKLGQNLASSGVTGSPSLTTSASMNSNVGSYAIAAAVGSLASGNYSFVFHSGSLSITKAALDVAADNKSKVYGEANPAFTETYSGFKLGQTLASSGVTGNPSLTTAASASSDVGGYVINAAAGTLTASNYSFIFHDGTLTITKAPLTVMADSKSKILNAANPPLTASYAGFKLGQTFATSGVTGAPSLTTTAVQSSPAGSYQITAAMGTLASGNYSFGFVNGVLTILYGSNGFLQPINDTAHMQTQMSVFKAGSTVPVKFQLLDANGVSVQSAVLPLWITPVIVGTTTSPIVESVYTDPPTSGTLFRTDGSQYIYNWQTPKNGTGNVYRIGARLDDGTTMYVNIGLK